jgi:hypothetical protein
MLFNVLSESAAEYELVVRIVLPCGCSASAPPRLARIGVRLEW